MPVPNPHIVVVNRWREHYADYAAYLDHTTHRVTYISTEVGLGAVPAAATDVEIVAATDDMPAVQAGMARLVRRHGAPRGVVALKEDDLEIGARLRVEWGLPGPQPAELVRFRDKLAMCAAVAAAGHEVPAFAAYTGPESARDLAATEGWPLVLKPRTGSASDGVVLLTGLDDLAEHPVTKRPMLLQAFDRRPIHHVDGVFTGTELACWRVSRYVNTCLGFREGSVLGSIEIDDAELVAAIGHATTAYMSALTSTPTPFHLEVFADRDADGAIELAFLEVGARVGGSEIPFVWRDLHGVDLMRCAFDLQLGRPLTGTDPRSDGEIGGWLLVPAPAARPCVITEATPMVGHDPGPYAEALLRPGEVLPAADAYYEHVGGRFRFRGATSAEVEAAVRATAAGFRVDARPLAVAGRVAAVAR